ncbi:transposase [Methanofollis ethanolicus]|uniref:transposase n=1 Tax=Methanofollis ethanolicus TaxID=488124 RepID=UPI001366163E|nr:transposase [Methanofollis ethanolicus]
MFDGILYVLATERIRHDVPAKYGTKSAVHRYHLEPREKGVSQAIILDLLRSALHRDSVRLKRRISYLKAIVALAHKMLRLL